MIVEQIFDAQFWSLLLIGSIMVFLGGWILKNVIVTAVSKSVAEVVRDQWAQMFKKMDEYSKDIQDLRADYEKLRSDFNIHVNKHKE